MNLNILPKITILGCLLVRINQTAICINNISAINKNVKIITN